MGDTGVSLMAYLVIEGVSKRATMILFQLWHHPSSYLQIPIPAWSWCSSVIWGKWVTGPTASPWTTCPHPSILEFFSLMSNITIWSNVNPRVSTNNWTESNLSTSCRGGGYRLDCMLFNLANNHCLGSPGPHTGGGGMVINPQGPGLPSSRRGPRTPLDRWAGGPVSPRSRNLVCGP